MKMLIESTGWAMSFGFLTTFIKYPPENELLDTRVVFVLNVWMCESEIRLPENQCQDPAGG